jgi:hypothetical protein
MTVTPGPGLALPRRLLRVISRMILTSQSATGTSPMTVTLFRTRTVTVQVQTLPRPALERFQRLRVGAARVP